MNHMNIKSSLPFIIAITFTNHLSEMRSYSTNLDLQQGDTRGPFAEAEVSHTKLLVPFWLTYGRPAAITPDAKRPGCEPSARGTYKFISYK